MIDDSMYHKFCYYYYYNVYKFTGFSMKPLRIDLDYKRVFLCSQLVSSHYLKVLIESTTSWVVPCFDWMIIKRICLYSSMAVLRKVAYKLEVMLSLWSFVPLYFQWNRGLVITVKMFIDLYHITQLSSKFKSLKVYISKSFFVW